MGEKYSTENLRKWVVEHKLRTVGCLWLGGIATSIAYNWSRPGMKTSVKVIHASRTRRLAIVANVTSGFILPFVVMEAIAFLVTKNFSSQLLSNSLALGKAKVLFIMNSFDGASNEMLKACKAFVKLVIWKTNKS